jgi:hypothetical protein
LILLILRVLILLGVEQAEFRGVGVLEEMECDFIEVVFKGFGLAKEL